MIRAGALFVVLVVGGSGLGQEAGKGAAVKRLAEELGVATVKGEYGKVIDQTYPTLVELLGGREKAIATAEAGMKLLKDRGITIDAFRVGQPGEFLTEGGTTFVVIPTAIEMKGPGLRIIGKSYLLGLSADGGKSWKFVDGAGMDDKALRDKVLPKFPANLKLPEKEKPEVIKDK